MLNYANLNDMEFESLCRDIMERMLGVSLRRFGPGRDGGVDLADNVDGKGIVVQVKHYQSSTPEKLIRSLKKELSNVRRLSPRQYYICCSRMLSAANINELYLYFQNYMGSDRNIITLNEIDDFLKKKDNRDILKKHFKLWLDDTGILQELRNDDIFVDCEAFLDDADELHKLFVQTKAFDNALKVLENDQTLCIIGDPGVGKSITSKMLVLYYAAQGYRVRYTTNVSDLGVLKSAIRNDPESQEIILLDDCFGQAYFEMKSTQSSELISLIKFVKKRKNKVLILNSRVTIFQEAQQRQRDLVQSLERNDFRVHVLDINKLSDEEKAKILYNHLAFSGIPNEYFEDIRTNQRYWQIIKHRNYNPRIIEYVCNPKRYQSVSPSNFYQLFKKHLDDPKEMWKDEYEDRLKPEDRILLQTIYSLTATTVNASLVRQCFNRRIVNIPTIDKTVDQFNRSLSRLNEGFIRILDNNGNKDISMQNPSVNDFLDGRLLCNNAERADLLSSICTVYQLRVLPSHERIPYIENLLQSGQIDPFFFSSPLDRSAVIGYCILSCSLCMEQFRPDLLSYLMDRLYLSFMFDSIFPGRINVRKEITNPEIWNFYHLQSFFEEHDHLYRFLGFWEFDESVEFIRSVDDYFHGKNRILYIQQVEKYLTETIEEYREVDATDYEGDVDVEEAVRSAVVYSPDGGEIDEIEAAATLDEYIREEAFCSFRKIIDNLPAHFRHLAEQIEADDFDVNGSDEIVEDFISNPPGHYDYDDEKESDTHPYSPVDAIFQR